MNSKLLLCLILIVLGFGAKQACAAPDDSLSHSRKIEFCISEGIFSFGQLKGIFGNEAVVYRDFVDMPHTYSGAVFLSGKYYISHKIALGAALGLDNQRGRLSYGGPHSSYSMVGGSSGSYNREFYTFALEGVYVYDRSEKVIVYCLVGAGATAEHIDYGFYSDAKYGYANWYSPIHENHTWFSTQVTPLAFRVGGRLSYLLEFGFGYKGLIVAGLSYTP